MDSKISCLVGWIFHEAFVGETKEFRGGSRRHFLNMIFFWDPGIIFGLNYFSWWIHVVVCGIETPIKRKEMHNVNYFPKIDLYFFHDHQILLNDIFLYKTSPCFHYDHFGFLCMRVGLVIAHVTSPYYMSTKYVKCWNIVTSKDILNVFYWFNPREILLFLHRDVTIVIGHHRVMRYNLHCKLSH